ncbi:MULTISPECIES: hypothetical protein [unclassified Lentimicrobium]|uniref:DUF6929 family protein n=1 Tax=unclassified Lentimicrobium TaxID=2677434 RepID=UPI0015566299|nr:MULTISPECIES: hypothetical protein [unclassified Lentimicrobium]NPD47706.1 hypothetical protein [Lentimicrobium sp. S6]NPD83890.1 hypothetical protein [Lentimicrobium sp. L6]
MTYFYRFVVLLLLISSCSNPIEEGLFMRSSVIIETIPSASGVICDESHIWLVGDDVAPLFEVNNKLEVVNQYTLSKINNKVDGRILKSLKADFESMDISGDEIIVLGSGSKEISRDTAFVFNKKTRMLMSKKSIRPLFDVFIQLGNYDSLSSINIEGLTSCSNYFYLLQRGNIGDHNDIFRISKPDFLSYLYGGDLPLVEIYHFQLPMIEEYMSGFSGACISPDEKFLIFTSSVESTLDVYHDGEVLGSFIGMIPLQGVNALNQIKSWPVKENELFIKTKLESVCVKNQEHQLYDLLCVSDNDDGKSGIYEFTLIVK